MAGDWTVHILAASGDLQVERAAIFRAIDAAKERVRQVQPLHNIDLLVQHDRAIPEIGVGGFNLSANLIWLKIDPDNPACAASLAGEQFTRIVTHEAHHAMRKAAVGDEPSLGAALVFEGLAGQFAAALHGTEGEIWDQAVGADDLAAFSPDPETLAHSVFDYNAWFYGTGKLPKWFGYSLGSQMAAVWVDQDPTRPLAQLISVPTADVIKAWQAVGRL